MKLQAGMILKNKTNGDEMKVVKYDDKLYAVGDDSQIPVEYISLDQWNIKGDGDVKGEEIKEAIESGIEDGSSIVAVISHDLSDKTQLLGHKISHKKLVTLLTEGLISEIEDNIQLKVYFFSLLAENLDIRDLLP